MVTKKRQTSRCRSVSVAISRRISSKHKKRWPGLAAPFGSVMAWGMAKNNHRIHGFMTCYNYTNYHQNSGYIYIYICMVNGYPPIPSTWCHVKHGKLGNPRRKWSFEYGFSMARFDYWRIFWGNGPPFF